MNEKITDKARGMFEKATGYVVTDPICLFPYTLDLHSCFLSMAFMPTPRWAFAELVSMQ